MLTINIAIILPFLAALILLLFFRNFTRLHIGWFVLIVPSVLFLLLVSNLPVIASGETKSFQLNWIPSYHINWLTYLDGLNMIFGILITGIGILVVLYSIYYLSTEQSLIHFYIYLLMFMGSMLGVVFSNHLLHLYVFWELTSISSFLLIAFWYQRKGSRYGAKKSLLITVFGGFSMLAAFLMIYVATGTFNIQEIIAQADVLKEHPLLLTIMILLLLGAFTKSAQFPFHIWLPDAMEAPTPVSAYLHSATMVKAGIYLIARFTPVFGGESFWFWAVTVIGLITLFWAAFIAIRQSDLKALLAYSTVSQLGLIMTLFGISSLSFHPNIDPTTALYNQAALAALFHLINHSTFKGALFMVVGIIDFQMGTRDLRRLGGLLAVMPVSFTIALIGSFSMAGLPPFNGFLSKEMFFTALIHLREFDFFSIESVSALFPIIGWVASIFTFVYSMMIVFQTFFGSYKEQPTATSKEPPVGMLFAPIVLSVLVVVIFFFPNVLKKYMLDPALFSIYPEASRETITATSISLWHGFNLELWMTIGIILLGVGLYLFQSQFRKIFVLFPKSLSFDTVYHLLLQVSDKLSKSITDFYMTGILRHYMTYIFLFFILLFGGAYFFLDGIFITVVNDRSIQPFEWILAGTIIIAGITILLSKSRLTAILINGYIGFAIAMFFVLFRAPDLALTQLVVETVTTTLFLLCFYFLPEWKPVKTPSKVKWTNIIISISVGTIFTITALRVNSGKLFPSISSFFEKTEELTGGRNIVNTILGDFRAFDTMLEVIVLFIAGMGVYTLIKYTTNKGAEKIEDK